MTNIIQTITKAFTQSTTIAETPSVESPPFIGSKQEFQFFQQAFKEKARNKQTTADDILLYNIVRGKNVDRGFTPVTNTKKLAGGEDAYKGMRRLTESKRHLRWVLEVFIKGAAPGPLAIQYGLTREMCTKIVAVLKGD